MNIQNNSYMYQSSSSLLPVSEVNPYKLNGISHSYQLDQSISVLRVVGWNFSFLSIC